MKDWGEIGGGGTFIVFQFLYRENFYLGVEMIS